MLPKGVIEHRNRPKRLNAQPVAVRARRGSAFLVVATMTISKKACEVAEHDDAGHGAPSRTPTGARPAAMSESDRRDPGRRGADRHDHPDLARTWRKIVLLDEAWSDAHH